MHLARSSYRLQLHREFTFKELKKIIPYLDRLGVSTIYAAPIFGAVPGSNHGYDVINPHIINPEIGTLDELRVIAKELKARNMQWLQDIVPNHMAFTSKNPWLYDVMEKGPHSPFYHFFDINWFYPEKSFYGKLMVPTLGTPLKRTIRNGEISLSFGELGFFFAYYDHHFPANMSSYVFLTTQATEIMSQAEDKSGLTEFISLAKRIDDFVRAFPNEAKAADGWEILKEELIKLSEQNKLVSNALQSVSEKVSSDYDLLEEQLKAQYFRLSHWRITNTKINYRRFFTVNDLICLNMQEKSVFDTYHLFIRQLLDEDLIQGIRVDHIDGLLDPSTYIKRLRELAGPDTYITIEKILEGEETLPEDWPIEGTSGYDFLSQTNQLLTNQNGAKKLLEFYHKEINPGVGDYGELVFFNKRYILEKRMAGDLENLVRLLDELDILPYREATPERQRLKEALGHFLVYFPVYRTYSNSFPFSDEDIEYIKETFELAENKHPDLSEYFQRLREIFNGVDDKSKQDNANKLYYNLRSQQFTGPLAAKGVEDTTFYQYFPLISLNEVGDSPGHLGSSLRQYQEQMQRRPLKTMNTTATHDTKRGEDARMRISVLSEIPDEWTNKVTHWQHLNEGLITRGEERMPDKNDEYFFYQTLVGSYPFHISPEEDDLQQRLLDYLLKSIREAKVHSSWSKPNKAYREAYLSFVEKALQTPAFIQDFEEFARDIARTAAVYSLAQTVLRICAPGVPDTYQGTEFWDLSMVDPDNRRPVNYEDRNEALNEMEDIWQQDPSALLEKLRDDLLNPHIKLFTLYQCLNTRKVYRPLFDQGTYETVKVEMEVDANVLAFRRITEEAQALIIIPLGIRSIETQQNLPLGKKAWKGSKLLLGQAAGDWHHVLLKRDIQLEAETNIAELLSEFPVALLIKN